MINWEDRYQQGVADELARAESDSMDWSEHSSVSSERFEVRQNLGISLADVYPMLSSPFIL